MVNSANLSLGLHLDIKQRCSSSEKHELCESHPSTVAIYSLLVPNSDSNLCSPPFPALLCIMCYGHSEQQLEFHFLPGRSQPRLRTHPCLSHNPADGVPEQQRDQPERRQAPRLSCFTGSKQQCSAICSFSTYFHNSCYTLTELTGEREVPSSGSQPPGLPFSTGKMLCPPVSSVKHKTCSPNQQQPWWL